VKEDLAAAGLSDWVKMPAAYIIVKVDKTSRPAYARQTNELSWLSKAAEMC